MPDRITINERVTVGPQPSGDDFAELKRLGYRAVVNLRAAGEPELPFSPEEEEVLAARQELKYLHVAMPGPCPRLEDVDRLSEEMDRLPAPIFVHDRTGSRAGLVILLYLAEEEGWSVDDVLEKAREMNFGCESDESEEFVRGYLKKRRRAAAVHPHQP